MRRECSRAARIAAEYFIGIFFAIAAVQVHGAAVYPADRWEKLPTDDRSWSPERLKVADEFARTLQTDAYLVVHRGHIVHEYGSTNRATNVHSVRKSILSVLYGIYLERVPVDLKKTLRDLGVNDRHALSQTELEATVQQLMQARSGIYHAAAYETDGMAARRPERGSHKPGEHWYYNNWDFNALGTIFKKVTGKTVFEALRDDLAKPLQFQDFSYSFDTRWVSESASEHPAYIMRVSARDLARIGVLMARKGKWREQQLLPEAWVQESTLAYSNTGPTTGYGYMWWVGSKNEAWGAIFPGAVYWAHGNRGQVVLIDPVRDFVFVHRVNTEADRHRRVADSDIGKLLNLINGAYTAALPAAAPAER